MSLLEPAIAARLAAGAVASACFVHAAYVGLRVLRHFRVASTAEGQLALERQAELGAASARVGAAVQLVSLVLTVLTADRLTASVRGAMCGYGVVHANEAGPYAVGASLLSALVAGVLLQLLGLDARTRSLAMVRPVAAFSIGLAAVSLADLGLTLSWLGGLDFSVVASCCSAGLDAGAAGASAQGGPGTARVAATVAAAVLLPLSAAQALFASRRPGRAGAVAAGVLSAMALPAAIMAAALEVAPHVYEIPHHRCPYCLFRADAWFVGYPLFGAALLGAVWGLGAAASALLSRPEEGEPDPFPAFARRLLRREALAWLSAALVAALPVARYAWITGGASLFR